MGGTCHALFVGEGPGEAEDVIGRPFIGPAGAYFRDCIQLANPSHLSLVLANLVMCRPHNPETGKNRTPYLPEIEACRPRLTQFFQDLDPLSVVLVGKVAEEHLPPAWLAASWTGAILPIPHPSYMIRRGAAPEGEESLDYIATLSRLFDSLRLVSRG